MGQGWWLLVTAFVLILVAMGFKRGMQQWLGAVVVSWFWEFIRSSALEHRVRGRPAHAPPAATSTLDTHGEPFP